MEEDLLANGSVAGSNLLGVVSRGSAIIAELLRLSDHIPPVFYLSTKAEQAKYGAILHDFSYLRNAEVIESRVSADADLADLDEEFKESNMELLTRFYKLFDSIHRYISDVNRFLADVEEGVYIQLRLDDLVSSPSGKQLLSEGIYLYGLMLTLLDNRIEGPVRERMLISYYRYKGSSENLTKVSNLCRSSGYLPSSAKRPANYPEDLFARVAPPQHVVLMVVNRLRSDDIYNQMAQWPSPDHRCTALASQAAILYIVLFFVPSVLHKESAMMREIVDKHFSDNWVISFYMGFVVDLSVMWEPYKAAHTALKNTLDPAQVKEIHLKQVTKVDEMLEELAVLLQDGVVTDDYVLDNTPKLLSTLRQCNVVLRWTMLHRNARSKKVRDVLSVGLSPDKLLRLLLKTAQLEFKLSELLKSLLATKQARWNAAKKECHERISELAMYFSGDQVLTRGTKDARLQAWFSNLAGEVEKLSHEDATVAGRKMQQLSAALQDVEEFHQVETNSHVKHFLQDARALLKQMVRTVNVKEGMLVTLAAVSDLSFAFDIISDYVDLMHALIRTDPSSVLLLRATFLKLASVLDLPLVRIMQAGSDDLSSVAEYYSSQLVAFVRQVLEVVPVNVFLILNDIIALQAKAQLEIPSKIDKATLAQYALLDDRYALAKATHQVSVFAEGVLAMERTLMGVVEVDPKQLLTEGICKELVRQITMSLHGILIFPTGKIADFERRLEEVRKNLDAFRRSFEYISDYINIFGLKIWQEQLTRIVNFAVEQECNVFLKKKIHAFESAFQSEAVPLPLLPPTDDQSVTFIGRVTRELLLQTDPSRLLYLEAHAGWFDRAGKDLVGIRTLSLLHQAIGTAGLRGIDQTLSFLILSQLRSLLRFYRRQVGEGLKMLFPDLQAELNPSSTLPNNAALLYQGAFQRTAPLWPSVATAVSRIGQAQLLRRQMASELNFSAKLDSPTLAQALEAMNEALLNDILLHYRNPEVHPYPSDEKKLLPTLAPYLDSMGLSCPMLKIYLTTEPMDGIALFLMLFAVAQLTNYTLDPALNLLVPKEKNGLDSAAITVGILTVLKQFHSSHTQKFVAYLLQYVRCQVVVCARDPKAKALPQEVSKVLALLKCMSKFSPSVVPRALIYQHLPPFLFDRTPR